MRLGTERQDWANLHGHIPGVSTAFNSGAAPPVLRAGHAWCLIMYLDRVITGRLAKAALLQAESLQQERSSVYGQPPPCWSRRALLQRSSVQVVIRSAGMHLSKSCRRNVPFIIQLVKTETKTKHLIKISLRTLQTAAYTFGLPAEKPHIFPPAHWYRSVSCPANTYPANH